MHMSIRWIPASNRHLSQPGNIVLEDRDGHLAFNLHSVTGAIRLRKPSFWSLRTANHKSIPVKDLALVGHRVNEASDLQ